MAMSQLERRRHWWPPFSEWFEDFPVDLRLNDGEHTSLRRSTRASSR
jgi:hypothetical protein